MINYVIINGVNSNTKTGLMINELPPITKPFMRSEREEIDGRDGDIITKLGYSAYDKTITIGLWGTGYDVNSIISFFTSEGTITFSNEPDKYYKFTMLEQIDVESLLRFKTASITFHCQPYKYPTEETPLEIEFEYIEQSNVESASVNNTEQAPMKLSLKGNTSQYTTTGKNKANVPSSYSFDRALNIFTLPAGTYYVSCGVVTKGGANAPQIGDSSSHIALTSNMLNQQLVYSSEAGVTLYSNGWNYTESSVTSNVKQLMITTSPISSLSDYEEYSGGIPAPNPDYPYPVNVVSGDNEVVVCGKNLLDSSILEAGGISTSTGEDSTGNTRRTNGYIKVKPSTKYSFQYKTTSNNKQIVVYEYASDKSFIKYSVIDNLSGSVTLSSTTEYIRVRYSGDYSVQSSDIYNVQIELGDLTYYEPYTSQTYPIYLGVENLFDKTIISDASSTVVYKQVYYGIGTYTFSSPNMPVGQNNTANIFVLPNYVSTSTGSQINGVDKNTPRTLTSTDGYITFAYRSTTAYNTHNPNDYDFLLNIGSTIQHVSSTPIELCKIGDYQDYFYKDNGKWYKYNAIGKGTITSVSSVGTASTGIKYASLGIIGDALSNGTLMCEKYLNSNDASKNNSIRLASTTLYIYDNRFTDSTTALNLLNGLEYLYPLENPYLSLITDDTLKTQLDNIQGAMSYEGRTNISQVNNDKPFLLDLKAMKKDTNQVVVNNIGNATSKPLIALEGNGNVEIYLNDNQILQANVEDKMNIDIDTLEAYNPDTSALLNRQVIGNYNSMTLPSGNSTIKINGNLTKATITNYERWL